MRDAYHEQLDSVGHTLVEMAELVGQALSRATRALLETDLPIAEAEAERAELVVNKAAAAGMKWRRDAAPGCLRSTLTRQKPNRRYCRNRPVSVVRGEYHETMEGSCQTTPPA